MNGGVAADGPTAAGLIDEYRKKRNMSWNQLTDAVNARLPAGKKRSRSLVIALAHGGRRLDRTDPDVRRALSTVLEFEGEDRDRFFSAAVGLPPAPTAPPAHPQRVEGERPGLGADLVPKSLIAVVAEGGSFLRTAVGRSWYGGRMAHFNCEMPQAVAHLTRAVERLQRQNAARTPNLAQLVYLDTADALCCAAKSEERSKQYARAAGRLARGVREKYGPRATRMMVMAVARPLLMEQTILMARCGSKNPDYAGRCEDLHRQAADLLRAADDRYGWAKSYYNLAFIKFHTGDLGPARELAEASVAMAEQIQWWPHRDSLWNIRDGFRIAGKHWWLPQARSLLYDILVCSGERATLPGTLWSKHFPSFAPRYSWVDDIVQQRGTVEIESRFDEWITHARQNEWRLYLPDIHLSYGDFLTITRQDHAASAGQYEEATRVADELGFSLTGDAARRRHPELPPLQGLAQLLAQQVHSLRSRVN